MARTEDHRRKLDSNLSNLYDDCMSLVGVLRRVCAVFVVVCATGVSVPASLHAERSRTLVVGMLSEPNTLNPLVTASSESKDIIARMFAKLLDERGDFHTFHPLLAEKWSFSKEGLAITFDLRDDAVWADGEPVTATDVRFSWELQTDTLVAWSSADIKSHITDVEIKGPHTVVFHFDQRYPDQLMDANDGVIMPHHLLKDVPRAEFRTHEFGRAPVGCGPYAFKQWLPGEFIELVANPRYFESEPVVDRVIFKFVPDIVTMAAELEAGEIDAIESIPADQIPRLSANPNFNIYTYPSRRMNYVAWNLRRDLFTDVQIREALTLAIDRNEIMKTIWGGYAQECTSPVHPILWAYDSTIRPVAFDPARAKSMLRQRGWRDSDKDGVLDKDGVKFEFDLLTNNSQLRVDVVTMIEAQLRHIGVRAKLNVLEYSTYIERILSGNYDAAFIEWKTATKVDLTNLWHSKSMRPDGFNVAYYSNKKVDAWIDAARVELDSDDAQDLWYKAQRAIYEDRPFTFLAVPQEVCILHARFCNVEPNSISFFANLREWRIAPDCN